MIPHYHQNKLICCTIQVRDCMILTKHQNAIKNVLKKECSWFKTVSIHFRKVWATETEGKTTSKMASKLPLWYSLLSLNAGPLIVVACEGLLCHKMSQHMILVSSIWALSYDTIGAWTVGECFWVSMHIVGGREYSFSSVTSHYILFTPICNLNSYKILICKV
jgi:uncharacterized membrane protein YhdT